MSAFPVLKTGAVMQYPAGRKVDHQTRVLVFLDGSEQRFRESAGPARRWIIRLDYLDETEMAAVEGFMIAQQGRLGSFSFTDPWDGAVFADCSLESDVHALEFREVFRGSVSLVVKENRG